jgi:hypothetical protein
MRAADLRARAAQARRQYVPSRVPATTYADPELVAQEYDAPARAAVVMETPSRTDIAVCMRNRDRDNGARALPGEKTLAANT